MRHISLKRPELTAGRRPTRPRLARERPYRRYVMLSVLFHVLLLAALMLAPPGEEQPPEMIVELVADNGAMGSAGGNGSAGTQLADSVGKDAEADKTDSGQSEESETNQEPQTQDAQPQPQADPQPVPQPQAETTPQPPPPTPTPPPPPPNPSTETAQTASASSGAPGGNPGGDESNGGAASEGIGSGAADSGEGPGDDYFDRLRRHLAKFKAYPEEAAKQKQEGTVMVKFVLARDGTVLSAEIDRGSGYPLLDQAALDMLHKASPAPPLPDRVKSDKGTIVMPIEYKLGTLDKLF